MAQQNRMRPDARESFDLRTNTERRDFLIDLQLLAQLTSRQAQLAIVCAPPDHKAEVLRTSFNSLAHGLFGRFRESYRTRIRIGLFFTEGAVNDWADEAYDWADETIGTDVAWALVPGSMQFRFKAGHPREGQSVNANEINALSWEDNAALEEIPYPLREQELEFYLKILHAWLPEACRAASSEGAPWFANVQVLLSQMAERLQECITFARSEGRKYLFSEYHLSLIESTKPAKPTKLPPAKLSKLPPKKLDLRGYLDSAKLTERQYDCISLRLEYGLTVSAIARRLSIDRSVVYEHIQLAHRKINSLEMVERARSIAKSKPDEQSR